MAVLFDIDIAMITTGKIHVLLMVSMTSKHSRGSGFTHTITYLSPTTVLIRISDVSCQPQGRCYPDLHLNPDVFAACILSSMYRILLFQLIRNIVAIDSNTIMKYSNYTDVIWY